MISAIRLRATATAVSVLAGLSMALALSACSLPRVTRRPAQTEYRLRAPRVEQPAPGLRPLILRLQPVRAAPGLQGVDMLYSPTPLQLLPYRDSRWLVPPAEMIDAALRDTLARQPWVAAVVGGDAPGRADGSLRCRLDSLEHDVYAQRVELGLRCQIYTGDEQALRGAWSFQSARPVDEQNAAQYAQATQDLLNRAVAGLLRQVARTLSAAPPGGAAAQAPPVSPASVASAAAGVRTSPASR